MTQRSFKKYIFTILSTTILLLGTGAVFNVIVDPYGMNRLVNIRGFNICKPETFERIRLLKSFEVRRVKPDSIILGSSRCHIAFRTSHEGWAKYADRRYNLAFDSASTKEMYYYLIHAYAIHPLKLVILGLDPFHLNTDPAKTEPDFDAGLLMNDNGFLSHIKMTLADLKILTSLDALKDSLKTIASQKTSNGFWLSPDGQRLGDLFFHRQGSSLQKFGPRYYFEETDKSDIQHFVEKKSSQSKKPTFYHKIPSENNDPLTTLDYLRKIIDFCRSHGITLKIFLTPAHARHLELVADSGKWQSMENEKRRFVRILAEDARQHPYQPSISLFDFSNYSEITTETLPSLDSRTEMKFYWDSSHAKEIVGDMVLNRILNIENTQNSIPEDFGILLTEDNIESVIAQMRNRHDLYKKNHLQEIETIQSWVEDFKKKNNINE